MKVIVVVLVLAIIGAVGVAILVRPAANTAVAPPDPKSEAADAAQTSPPPPAVAQPAATPTAEASEVQLYGAVIDAVSGTPVKEATISLLKRERRRGGEEGDTPPAEAKTDEQGAYTLEVPEGEYRAVACAAKGYTRFEHPMDEKAQGKVRIDFQLQPGGTITGSVLDEADGKPIEGVTIRVVSSQQNFMEMMMERGRGGDGGLRAKSEADGTYMIDGVPEGSFRLVASARSKGYLVEPEDERQLEIAAGATYEHIDFNLDKGASVKGMVVNTSGGPVKDATVMIMPTQFFQTAMRTMNSMNTDPFEGMDDRTDEQGHFEIIGLEFGTEYRARAKSDDYADGSSEAFKAAKGSRAPQVTVTLAKGSTISGVARFASGEPAPNEMLLLFPVSREAWGQFEGPDTQNTSDKGEFTFKNVNAGEYLIRPRGFQGPMRANFREGSTPVTVAEGKDIAGLEVIVETEKDAGEEQGSGVIAGTVLTADGKPAAEVRVEARDAIMPMNTNGATSEADGTFTIKGLNAENYDLSVEDEKGIAEEMGVAVGTTITLKLQPPAHISGTVVTASGEPVASCSVSLKGLDEEQGDETSPQFMGAVMRDMFGGDRGGASTDAYGHFEFTKVKPGRYTVAAKSQSSGTADSEPISVDVGAKVDDLRIVLDPGVAVSGVIVGPTGEMVAGAAVQLVPVGSNQMADMMSSMLPAAMVKTAGSATTGPTGEFTMSRVPAGKYKLVGMHGTYARTSTEVTVKKGVDVTGLRLALQKSGGARGTYAIDGKPQPNVMVMVMGPNGFQMVQTDSQGQFDVAGLTSGSYMVTAFDPARFAEAGQGGMQFTPRVVDIAEGQIADVDMGGGGGGAPVSGTIAGSSGATTVVALRRPGGPSLENINVTNIGEMIEAMRYLEGQTIVESDGTFTLGNVEPGEYVLEVYSVDVNPGSPDMSGLMNAMRTPAHRETITVGAAPTPLTINLTP